VPRKKHEREMGSVQRKKSIKKLGVIGFQPNGGRKQRAAILSQRAKKKGKESSVMRARSASGENIAVEDGSDA